jgi:hypothetical protein
MFPATQSPRSLGPFALDALCIALLLLALAPVAQRYQFLDMLDRGWWWTDGHYNLQRAYYAIKGFVLYRDIPSAQFPGTHMFFAAFLKLLGYANATPAPQLLPQLEKAGIYLTGAIQLSFFFIALRLAGFARILAALASFVLVHILWESYGQFLPLVESLMVPFIAIVVCLLARLAFGPPSELFNTLLLLGLAVTFGVVLGLTAAPTFLFWSLFAIVLFAFRWLVLHEAPTFRPGFPVVFWGIVWTVFVVWTFRSVELTSMVYWTITNPSEATRIPVLAHIKVLLTSLPRGMVRYSQLEREVGVAVPFLAMRQFGFVAIATYCYVVWRFRPSEPGPTSRVRTGMIVALGVALCFGFLLTGWRYPTIGYNHKSVAALGITIAILALALNEIVRAARRQLPAGTGFSLPRRIAASPLVAALCVGLSLLIAGAALWPHRYRAVASERDPALDAAAICRLGKPGPDCSCILQAFYDPRRFLELDVHPCVGYSPDQPNMISAAKRSRDQLGEAVENTDIAFLVGLSSRESLLFDIPLAFYERIVSTRTCRPVYYIFRVCSRPRP